MGRHMTSAGKREQVDSSLSAPINPIYRCEPGSNFIALGEAPVEIAPQQTNFQGIGQPKLRLQPSLSLIMDSEFIAKPIEAHIAMSQSRLADFKYGTHFLPAKAIAIQLSLQSAPSMRLLATLMPNP